MTEDRERDGLPEDAAKEEGFASVEPSLALPPLQIGVQRDPGGAPVVLLTIATLFGPQTYPLDPAIARRIGAQLQQEGSSAASPLAMPKRGLIIPR